MIEMAKLLGLGQKLPGSPEESGLSSQDQSEEEWKEPFPAHPDQGGEPRPGHAPSKAAVQEDAAKAPKAQG